MKRKRILRNKWNNLPITVKVSIAYTICGMIQKLIQFFAVPIFTRIMTTEQFGKMTVYVSWMGILTVFLTLQLPYGSFSKAMIKFEEDRDGYLSAVEGICLVFSTVFLLIFFALEEVLKSHFGTPMLLVLLMVFEILANAGIAFWTGKKRFEFRYKSVVLVTLLISVLCPLLQFVLVVNCDDKGNARIVGNATVFILFGITIFIMGLVRGKKILNKTYWKYALGFNLPLLLYYLSQIVFDASDRIMIDRMEGTDKAGIYGVAYNLAITLNFVLVAINNSYTPWFFQLYKSGKQEKNKTVTNLIAVFLSCILLLLIWLAPEVIYVFAGEAYSEAKWVIPPVAMSVLLLFYTQISANYEFYYENKKTLTIAAVLAAVTNIVLNYVFIPVFGFLAAGYTTLISYMVLTYFNYLARRKILKDHSVADNGVDSKMLLIILGVFTMIGGGGMVLYSFPIVRMIITALTMLVIVVLRKEVFRLFATVRTTLSKVE